MHISSLTQFNKLPQDLQVASLSELEDGELSFILSQIKEAGKGKDDKTKEEIQKLSEKYHIISKGDDDFSVIDQLLQEIVSKKDNALETYLSLFRNVMLVPQNDSPFEKYEDLNTILTALYEEYSLDELLLLPTPKKCKKEHLRALKAILAKNLAKKLEEEEVLSLKKDSLKGNPSAALSPEVFEIICEVLKEFKGYAYKLALSGWELGEKEIDQLIPIFKQTSTFKKQKILSLELSNNMINDKTVEKLANVFSSPESILQSWDLSSNQIGDLGAQTLLRYLESPRSVSLKFYNNRCSEAAVASLQAAADNSIYFCSFEG